MSNIRTHYDNLKVARDAPPKVIHAAYRSLSQKYHPDLNPNSPDADRIMAIINAAYEVFSDSIKRKQHDEWIAKMEETEEELFTANINKSPPPPPPSSKSIGSTFDFYKHIYNYWLWYLILGVFIWGVYTDNSSTQKNKPSTHNVKQDNKVQNNTGQIKEGARNSQNVGKQNNSPITPKYIRPVLALNGQPWPNKSGYIKGYKRLF